MSARLQEESHSHASMPWLQARHYMVEHPPSAGARVAGARYFCATIFDNGQGGTVIGASILRHREVIFQMSLGNVFDHGRRLIIPKDAKDGVDEAHLSSRADDTMQPTISFVDADCEQMTPRTSLLQGAFVFQVEPLLAR